jgi:enterochelin esterase-like enzyme
MKAPETDAFGVTFRFEEPPEAPEEVALVQEVLLPRAAVPLRRGPDGCWTLRFARPPVRRFEYRFELSFADGRREAICDPANPRRAPGAFGERSVIEFPDYRPPPFVCSSPPKGEVLGLSLPSPLLGADQPAMLWSAHGSDTATPLPVLVVLDGIEFAGFSGLVQMLDWAAARRRLPRMRALLLHPTERNAHYSADPVLAQALDEEILPAAGREVALAAGRRWRAGLGASLGGLALLHAHRLRPELFGALYLQSGTFIERGHLGAMEHADRIEGFVQDVLSGPSWPDPIEVEMTCGVVEENLASNRAARTALRRQGYPVHLHVMPDAHNWVAWRDAWLPHLPALLRKAWR